MEITISSKRFAAIEEGLREFTEFHVGKIAEEFENPKLNAAKVFFTSERNWQIVTINVTGKNVNINAKGKADVAQAALIEAVDKIIVQLRRYLDRVQAASIKGDPKAEEKIWTTHDLEETEDEFDEEV